MTALPSRTPGFAERDRIDAALAAQRLDALAEMQRAANQMHREGRFPAARLENDVYRDTFVTLAEVRTNTLALRLTYDAVDMTYDLEGSVVPRAGWPFAGHRISRHFDDRREAEAKLTEIAARFFRVSGFRCLVDM